MADLDLVPLLTFIAITSYTPGPNNVSSASMGLVFGFLRSLPYMLGIASGFVVVMMLCGTMSGILTTILPSLTQWLRWIGCAYILWLAWGTLRASYNFEADREIGRMGFFNGLFLQLLNVKVIIYGITLYTTFLSPVVGNYIPMLLSAAALAAIALSSVFLWALCGTALQKVISNPGVKKYINISLSLLLVYTAITLLHL
jgi:cysteine/O-acetylserine efflux protein